MALYGCFRAIQSLSGCGRECEFDIATGKRSVEDALFWGMTALGQETQLAQPARSGSSVFCPKAGIPSRISTMARGVRFAAIVRKNHNPMKQQKACHTTNTACPVFQLIGRIPDYWTLLSSTSR